MILITHKTDIQCHYFFTAMFSKKSSRLSLSPLYELQHLRLALYRLNAVAETNSPTIADLKRIVSMRINHLESLVDEAECIEA